jgi:hypothetical protein
MASPSSTRGGALAADSKRLWREVKGGKNGSQPQETKQGTQRTKREKGGGELGDGEKRIVADVPEHIHRQVRINCLTRGVLVRDYIPNMNGGSQTVMARATQQDHRPALCL